MFLTYFLLSLFSLNYSLTILLRVQTDDIIEPNPLDAIKGKKIVCRLCQGDHFTTRCPYKETLGGALGEGGLSSPFLILISMVIKC